VRPEHKAITAFCARMPPENPDRTDAAEERVVAVLQGIAQLWLKLLEFQQGPEQHVAVEQQLHPLQLSSSSPGKGSKNASSTRPCRNPSWRRHFPKPADQGEATGILLDRHLGLWCMTVLARSV
jgi:hypothetical protein